MATKAIKERELKRANLIAKFAEKRIAAKNKLQQLYKQLGESTDNYDMVVDEIDSQQKLLDALPRNASPKRKRNRCQLTGRPRGNYRDFKLCRNMIRKYAMMGYIPGIRKSSW